MSFTNIVGIIAMIFSLSIVPGTVIQIQKIRKRKTSDDISLSIFFMAGAAYFSWLLYGICIKSVFLIISQICGLISILVLLYFVLKYKTKKN